MTLAQMQLVRSSNRVHVKLREGNVIRLSNGQLNGMSSTDADAWRNILAQRAIPAAGIRRLFTRPEANLESERQEGQLRSGKELPDLNLWFVIDLPSSANAAEVANALNNLDIVEYAEPERLPSPLPTDIAPPTPDFASSQTYKSAPPTGIGVPTLAEIPGSDGNGVTFADLEYSWRLDHEDLELSSTDMLVPFGETASDPFNDVNHGTAVLGVIRGQANSYGIAGLAPASAAYVVPTNYRSGYNPAAAINHASSGAGVLRRGDIIIIEQQSGVCGSSCGAGQAHCGPLEGMQSVFDSISTATANGRVVLEAAGNGNVDLDSAACGTTFNRNIRDSGAIIVGAGSPIDRSRLSFSTYGSRVDVQGWGQNVTTTGYGDAFGPSNDERQRYTTAFAGTSSATSIVAGVALSVQGARLACGLPPLTSTQMRAALSSSGTPQAARTAGHIGPLPKIRGALMASPGGAACLPDSLPRLACEPVTSQFGDFDGDGKADLLFRRDTDGQTLLYRLNGAQVQSVDVLGIIGPEWRLAGIADFNGDGSTDLLFRRTGDGMLSLYLTSGGQVLAAQLLGAVGPDWDLVGTGDVNGDGRADLMFRRRSDGLLSLYLMDGFRILAAQFVGAVAPEWTVRGFRDFDGDGRADILFRRESDGMLALYLMNGFEIVAARLLGLVGLEWHIVGLGDFNGDGRADVLFRRNDGMLALHLMNGFHLLDARLLGAVGTEWSLVGTGDVDSDGMSDMVLRRVGDGQLSVFRMRGFEILSAQLLGMVGKEWNACHGQPTTAVAQMGAQ
jgi:serine protease